MPVEVGSVTLRAAAAATAASAALPPSIRIERPAWVASGWLVATMPCVARTGERYESKVGSVDIVDSRQKAESRRWKAVGTIVLPPARYLLPFALLPTAFCHFPQRRWNPSPGRDTAGLSAVSSQTSGPWVKPSWSES